jgi:hypothetical protein
MATRGWGLKASLIEKNMFKIIENLKSSCQKPLASFIISFCSSVPWVALVQF